MSASSISPAAGLRPSPDTLAEVAARIGVEVAGPHAAEVDRDGRFPREVVDALREERLLSAWIPTELGGGGASLSQVASAVEALSAHCASSGMIYAMHQIQVASLVRHGDTPWLQEYLRAVADHELLLASATTEKGIGGDVRSSSCAVEATDGRFHLVKHAPVISYGSDADAILATARRGPDSPPNDQVLVVVPVGDATLEQDGVWNALGFRGTCSDGFVLTADGGTDQIMADAYDEISATTMLPTSHVLWARCGWASPTPPSTRPTASSARALARTRAPHLRPRCDWRSWSARYEEFAPSCTAGFESTSWRSTTPTSSPAWGSPCA